ncbi:hypothetical protein SARC_09992 [Sphaeroforma arctica JP610]|uniref:MHD1 domain-containing protein n=1 Tax=Sphaeroforma arctica JP610 TaxID=667725 RepID=A0A0L0FNG4_9EUKA|nr:hypothetical protein SARC_09992 [Sphaeroforma arctica JP610]KNC77548.1 hypothetical protein SARC_09992 [Sphaeroforma arctica JP610]|eukprot:XP_014151450.1 hypothetical protein SARC_09992 [Sphaeroforma arctica JP610]
MLQHFSYRPSQPHKYQRKPSRPFTYSPLSPISSPHRAYGCLLQHILQDQVKRSLTYVPPMLFSLLQDCAAVSGISSRFQSVLALEQYTKLLSQRAGAERLPWLDKVRTALLDLLSDGAPAYVTNPRLHDDPDNRQPLSERGNNLWKRMSFQTTHDNNLPSATDCAKPEEDSSLRRRSADLDNVMSNEVRHVSLQDSKEQNGSRDSILGGLRGAFSRSFSTLFDRVAGNEKITSVPLDLHEEHGIVRTILAATIQALCATLSAKLVTKSLRTDTAEEIAMARDLTSECCDLVMSVDRLWHLDTMDAIEDMYNPEAGPRIRRNEIANPIVRTSSQNNNNNNNNNNNVHSQTSMTHSHGGGDQQHHDQFNGQRNAPQRAMGHAQSHVQPRPRVQSQSHAPAPPQPHHSGSTTQLQQYAHLQHQPHAQADVASAPELLFTAPPRQSTLVNMPSYDANGALKPAPRVAARPDSTLVAAPRPQAKPRGATASTQHTPQLATLSPRHSREHVDSNRIQPQNLIAPIASPRENINDARPQSFKRRSEGFSQSSTSARPFSSYFPDGQTNLPPPPPSERSNELTVTYSQNLANLHAEAGGDYSGKGGMSGSSGALRSASGEFGSRLSVMSAVGSHTQLSKLAPTRRSLRGMDDAASSLHSASEDMLFVGLQKIVANVGTREYEKLSVEERLHTNIYHVQKNTKQIMKLASHKKSKSSLSRRLSVHVDLETAEYSEACHRLAQECEETVMLVVPRACWHEPSMTNNNPYATVGDVVNDLYMHLRMFDLQVIQPHKSRHPGEPESRLESYHEWFLPIVHARLDLERTSVENTMRQIALREGANSIDDSLSESSVDEVFRSIYPVVEFIESLNWPVASVRAELTLAVTECIVNNLKFYAECQIEKVSEKVQPTNQQSMPSIHRVDCSPIVLECLKNLCNAFRLTEDVNDRLVKSLGTADTQENFQAQTMASDRIQADFHAVYEAQHAATSVLEDYILDAVRAVVTVHLCVSTFGMSFLGVNSRLGHGMSEAKLKRRGSISSLGSLLKLKSSTDLLQNADVQAYSGATEKDAPANKSNILPPAIFLASVVIDPLKESLTEDVLQYIIHVSWKCVLEGIIYICGVRTPEKSAKLPASIVKALNGRVVGIEEAKTQRLYLEQSREFFRSVGINESNESLHESRRFNEATKMTNTVAQTSFFLVSKYLTLQDGLARLGEETMSQSINMSLGYDAKRHAVCISCHSATGVPKMCNQTFISGQVFTTKRGYIGKKSKTKVHTITAKSKTGPKWTDDMLFPLTDDPPDCTYIHLMLLSPMGGEDGKKEKKNKKKGDEIYGHLSLLQKNRNNLLGEFMLGPISKLPNFGKPINVGWQRQDTKESLFILNALKARSEDPYAMTFVEKRT